MRIRLDMSYRGKGFFGWQIQPNKTTVQGVLEKELAKIFREKIAVSGAGRTDSGVHARHQVAHCNIPSGKIESHSLHKALNSNTPKALRIFKISEVEESFHARHNPHIKTYNYRFDRADFADPFTLDNHHHLCFRSLNISLMRDFVSMLSGTRDYASFCSTMNSSKTTIRTITQATLSPTLDDKFSLSLSGKGFLHHMVRIIAGTLIEVGKERVSLDTVQKAFSRTDYRDQLGPTLPAHGLTLEKTEYGV